MSLQGLEIRKIAVRRKFLEVFKVFLVPAGKLHAKKKSSGNGEFLHLFKSKGGKSNVTAPAWFSSGTQKGDYLHLIP